MIKDVDYEKSYAPVTQGISISLFCILLLYFGLEKYALDVESAFLLPDQKTEIWCELPEGVTIGGFKYYYLNKAMYGTVDASYQFHYYLSESLDKFGFKRHAAEPCLFYLLNETIKCLFLVHVDNLLCGCNNLPWLKKLIIDLKPKMILKFENSKSILGVQITREDKITISFSQEYYIDALIAEYKLEGTPVKHIPIRPGIEKDFDPGTMEPVKCDLPYRRLNMQLMWVARMSVHHINYACVFFARFGNCYNAELYKEMLNVLLYLKKIKSWKKKLVLKPYEKLDILFHCDASYNIFEDGRTAIGGIGYINNNPIYASCKVPSAVFTSSTESESHGAFETGKTAVFFWNWVSEFMRIERPLFIFNDNQAAVQILTNRINAGHSKHFNVKLRYINYLVEQKLIQVAFFKREFNTADLLTHALARPGFEMMLSKMHQGNTENLFLVASRFGGDLKYESGMTVCINFILK